MADIDMPQRFDLPCFVYGLFKPGELAFQRLSRLLTGEPARASIEGTLWIRDGLPLLSLEGRGRVPGYVLQFREATALEGYRVITGFEPSSHYRWNDAPVSCCDGALANVLVGRSPRLGSEELEGTEWTSRMDPVFTWGLAEVRRMAKRDGTDEFASCPPDSFDWSRLFRLQAAYLLLWSAVERYTALSFGPDTGPADRINRLGGDPLFAEALAAIIRREDRVFDARTPETKYRLDLNSPSSSAKYFYQVRSNLSHRGKGAWRDGEKVRLALIDLLLVFDRMLETSVFAPRPGPPA